MATSEELPGHVKAFIVQRLARFDRPSQVVKAVKEEFGLEVSRQRVHFYDPTKRVGQALHDDLKTMFFVTRETAKHDLDSIASFHKAIRLQRLDDMIGTAIERTQHAARGSAARAGGQGIGRRLHEQAPA